MKKQILTLLFLFSMVITYAQQQDYKAQLEIFCLNAKNNFKDITGTQTDTASAFYPSKIDPGLGDVKIGIFPNTTTLSWSIPLAQSKSVQVVVQEFIKTKFGDGKLYKAASDGTEDEGYILTNIYALGSAKPVLVFQTIYYRNEEDSEKSNFTITIYGK